MNKLIAAAALSVSALVASPAVSADLGVPSGAYKLDNTHASVVWTVKHLGLSNYTARFTAFDASLTLDVENPANSAVEAVIDASSVATEFPGEKDFDGEVANSDKFLNAGAHPEIKFTSTAIEVTGERTATITGDLTMLGVTQPLVLEATLNGALSAHPFAKAPAVGFSATGVVNRSDFGMDYLTQALPTGAAIVAPEVEVTIEAEFIKAE